MNKARIQFSELTRDRVIRIIASLPEDATIHEIVEALDYVVGIELGIADADAGRVTPHEEVLKLIESWKRDD